VLVVFLACLVVDVGQGVEFVDHNVDVVASDAVALAGYALAFVCAGDGVELTAAYFVLNGIEVSCNGVDAGRVAYKNHLVGQEFGLQVEVET